MAVAAEAAIHTYGLDAVPILMIDLDVHQGNGTASIFEGRQDVITFSIHGANNYPWRSKMRSTYDVDLPDDTGDEEYLATLNDWLPRLFATHKPRLVFFQAGVDALKGDKMGRLALSRAGLARRNHAVFSACLAAGCVCQPNEPPALQPVLTLFSHAFVLKAHRASPSWEAATRPQRRPSTRTPTSSAPQRCGTACREP